MVESRLNRRNFIKLGAALLLSLYGIRTPEPAYAPAVPFPTFDVGLNNAHVLDEYSGVTIRLPLDRGYFDKNTTKKDPFYGQENRLTERRQAGSNVILIMEIEEKDSESHLAGMLEYANEVIKFRAGDNIVLGNELNLRLHYSPDIYLQQAGFLQKNIKAINNDIQVGLSGDGWNGKTRFLPDVLSSLDFPIDFLPIHCYGLPQQIFEKATDCRRVLDYYGFDRIAVTIGETGVADSSYPDNPEGFLKVKPEEQTDIIIKALCFAKLAKCPSFSLYSASDTFNGQYMERFGLIDDRNNKRPSFYRFGGIQELFSRPSFIYGSFEEGKFIFLLRGPDTKTEISWDCPDLKTLGGPVKIS